MSTPCSENEVDMKGFFSGSAEGWVSGFFFGTFFIEIGSNSYSASSSLRTGLAARVGCAGLTTGGSEVAFVALSLGRLKPSFGMADECLGCGLLCVDGAFSAGTDSNILSRDVHDELFDVGGLSSRLPKTATNGSLSIAALNLANSSEY